MIKAVLVDCFGVLIGRGFEETYRTAGGDPLRDRAFIEDMLGQTNLGLVTEADFHAAMAGRLGIGIGEWHAVVESVEQPNTQLLHYLKELRPRYKTAVLSNANRGVVEHKIGEERAKACFDAVIASAEVGMVKPDPNIYHHAVERLGVELDEAVFIDDRQMHLDPAHALGMQTILYEDVEQTIIELAKILDAPGT